MIRLQIFPVIVVVALGGVDPQPAIRAGAELTALGQQPLPEQTAAARRALDEHDFARAVLLAAMAAARAPQSYEAALLLGLGHFRGDEPALALAPFARAVALDPASPTARFNLASALYRTGRLAEAEKRYLEAAPLDPKVAPLALYNAALAALDAGDTERARQHLDAAAAAARAAGQTPVADKAAALASSLHQRSREAAAPEIRELARAAKQALLARRYDDAVAGYQRALDAAVAEGASPADRAELAYGLGHALYRKGELTAAARAFEAALALAPKDPDFHYMLGLVHFDAGADRDAERALERALALGLGGGEAGRARDIVRGLKQAHRGDASRFFVEVRLDAGYDTNVPQSGVVISAQRGGSSSDTAAPYLQGDLDLFWRPAGSARNGLSLQYRFGQLAYLSSSLDPYSLQEHDFTVSGAWTPTAPLTLELGADGYLLFAGVETFATFQAGASAGPRITIREGHGFETRLRYQHVFKFSLDPNYVYLSGNRDEAGAAEVWRDPKDRLSLGYLFAREAIGVQKVALGDLELPQAAPGSFDPAAVYFIPYSYFGHEISLAAARDLPADFRGMLTLRYEHRRYDGQSYIEPPSGATKSNLRTRIDDRFGVDLAVRHPIGAGFEIELAYTFIVNRSTIDNSRPSTPLDYDNKNYFKHAIQLAFGFVY